METSKQTLRAYNLETAKAVFSHLQVNKELRAHEVNDIICAERGWDPHHITLSWNFNTIKQFLIDHGLAKKVVVNTNHVKWVATEKTLNARSFESAIAETPEERVEAFKKRYSKITVNDNIGFFEDKTTSPEVNFRGLKLGDKVAYYTKKDNKSGVGFVFSMTEFATGTGIKPMMKVRDSLDGIFGFGMELHYDSKTDKFTDGIKECEIIKL